MVRNVLGAILALLGATAAVSSPFRAWYDGRHGRYYRLGDLFTGAGVTDARAELFGSLFLPFVVAAAATLIGVVLRSRLLVAFAGVVVLAFTVLWIVRVGQAEGQMVVAGDGSGLGLGVAGAAVGGVLLLLGAAVMSGRQKRLPEDADQGYAGDTGPEPTHFTDPVPPPAPTLDGPQHTLEGPMQPYAEQPPYPDPPYEEPPYEDERYEEERRHDETAPYEQPYEQPRDRPTEPYEQPGEQPGRHPGDRPTDKP
ncbi:hypothetical protein OG698_26510 [Streptomyces sp. NBC_01003]|uniref:hypothetical protein n=1 Tax=Streptomyces sp. NBC_01003 TaxID=2903714 RepID=UPI00386E7441|nr:hypothetical protein OG698_26510 [Streptomyces sp. NBC_01003]